jgi:hypothetical protein
MPKTVAFALAEQPHKGRGCFLDQSPWRSVWAFAIFNNERIYEYAF